MEHHACGTPIRTWSNVFMGVKISRFLGHTHTTLLSGLENRTYLSLWQEWTLETTWRSLAFSHPTRTHIDPRSGRLKAITKNSGVSVQMRQNPIINTESLITNGEIQQSVDNQCCRLNCKCQAQRLWLSNIAFYLLIFGPLLKYSMFRHYGRKYAAYAARRFSVLSAT